MMNDRTKIDILREEILIPRMVQQKADVAYEMVREQHALVVEQKVMDRNRRNDLHKIRKTGKTLLFVAVALMLFAGFAVAAGNRWSVGISEKWQVEESLKESLQEEKAVSFAMQSQTQNGITITAEQSVTDNYSVYLAFRVEGYDLKEGLTPGFEEIQVTVDGMDGANYSAGFYDGMITGEDGILEYVDGEDADLDEEGRLISRYVREDGSLSYWISMTESERGWALGRDIHVQLRNLCGYEDKAGEMDSESVVKGIWNFNWNLQGTDKRREWILAAPLGDSGAVIRRVELSPASGYVECDWPRKRETRQVVGPDGELMEMSRLVRAPQMCGVRLKDGTEYRYLFSGDGTEGYVSSDQESIRYYACRGCTRIIDPEEVVSLFFENTDDGGVYEVVLEGR